MSDEVIRDDHSGNGNSRIQSCADPRRRRSPPSGAELFHTSYSSVYLFKS